MAGPGPSKTNTGNLPKLPLWHKPLPLETFTVQQAASRPPPATPLERLRAPGSRPRLPLLHCEISGNLLSFSKSTIFSFLKMQTPHFSTHWHYTSVFF